MSHSLREIAEQLRNFNKKVQLIYAFNGSGKTRLSREFKELIAQENVNGENTDEGDVKILYYNAFTEDLFYWENGDIEHKLKIQPNSHTPWVLQEQGQDQNAISHFQHYTNEKLTPQFSADFSEVTFSYRRGDDEGVDNLKISKGEESCFIWSIFYSLIEQAIDVLNAAALNDRDDHPNSNIEKFKSLKYIFIDDPVSSLDENHLIELAVSLAALIRSSESELKFIITTHNPLFYNVLHNELKSKTCYLLKSFDDGTFDLLEKNGDSNQSFSYHLYLKQTIEQAIIEEKVERYHFTLLRNLYEKTANFLGYQRWSELLPGDKEAYYNRIIQFTSHSTLSNEAVADPSPQEKQTVKFLLENLLNNFGYWRQEEHHD